MNMNMNMKRKMTVIAALSDEALADLEDDMFDVMDKLYSFADRKGVELLEGDEQYYADTKGSPNTVSVGMPSRLDADKPNGKVVSLLLVDEDGDPLGRETWCSNLADFKSKYQALCKKEGAEPNKAVITVVQEYLKRTEPLWKKYYSESANLKGNNMKKRVVAHIIMAALQVKAGNFGKAERLMAGLDEDVIEDTTDDLLDLVESSDDSIEVQDDEDLFDTESADLDSEDPFVLPDEVASEDEDDIDYEDDEVDPVEQARLRRNRQTAALKTWGDMLKVLLASSFKAYKGFAVMPLNEYTLSVAPYGKTKSFSSPAYADDDTMVVGLHDGKTATKDNLIDSKIVRVGEFGPKQLETGLRNWFVHEHNVRSSLANKVAKAIANGYKVMLSNAEAARLCSKQTASAKKGTRNARLIQMASVGKRRVRR